jgi:hypothetical protein
MRWFVYICSDYNQRNKHLNQMDLTHRLHHENQPKLVTQARSHPLILSGPFCIDERDALKRSGDH